MMVICADLPPARELVSKLAVPRHQMDSPYVTVTVSKHQGETWPVQPY